jgi:arabinan endo-1,5-alpha-L-arabinosidase
MTIRTMLLLVLAGWVSAQEKAPADGLIGHWKLDEASGDAADGSGKGNGGKLQGEVTSSTETPRGFVNARSLAFDGKSGRVNVGARDALVGQDALTIIAWVRPTANGEPVGIILNREGEYELARSENGRLQFAIASSLPGWDFVDTGCELPLKTWTHVAVTYSSEGKKAKAYANGKEVFSVEAFGGIGDTRPEENEFWIGGRSKDGGCEYFAGQIAEVRLYDRALSADEIRKVYASTLKE